MATMGQSLVKIVAPWGRAQGSWILSRNRL